MTQKFKYFYFEYNDHKVLIEALDEIDALEVLKAEYSNWENYTLTDDSSNITDEIYRYKL